MTRRLCLQRHLGPGRNSPCYVRTPNDLSKSGAETGYQQERRNPGKHRRKRKQPRATPSAVRANPCASVFEAKVFSSPVRTRTWNKSVNRPTPRSALPSRNQSRSQTRTVGIPCSRCRVTSACLAISSCVMQCRCLWHLGLLPRCLCSQSFATGRREAVASVGVAVAASSLTPMPRSFIGTRKTRAGW